MFFKVTTLRKQIFILANLFLLGLILLLFNLPGRAIAAPQADLVTVAPGNPIEIATITWWDWGQENQTILDAVALAIDDFGSIKGFNVQQNDYDGACDGGSGTTAANDVIANAQNIGVIGSLCSSSSGAAAAVLETVGVVMISPASTASDVYLNGPTVFNRVVITDPDFEGWNAKISYLPAVLAWQRNFEQIYGYQPGGFGKYAYDATWLLLTRLDEVSSLNGGNLEISRAALAAAVRGTSQT
ncbi:MAG TPA: hypothetical protein DEH25_01270, partial [Chloroflexi bacterium]|nr:hypothetical protein [Chloroflexota bacterium]